MKAILFALFVIVTDQQGNESLIKISEHNGYLSCYVEKERYSHFDKTNRYYCSKHHDQITRSK